jgi:FMN-dependent NADH-azoreductase
MPKLLHIQSSPRGERSASIAAAQSFLTAYRQAHPEDTVETLDLWHADIPPFDGSTLEAKYAVMGGHNPSGAQAEAWAAVTRLAEHFKSADKYLFSLPMWNFGIPYKLKHYIDVLVQPGLTFSFSPEKGYTGLVTGKPAVAIYARGGAYAPGTGAEGYDLQSKYLRQILGFIGMTDVKDIFVEPTLQKAEALEAGKKQAAELGATF